MCSQTVYEMITWLYSSAVPVKCLKLNYKVMLTGIALCIQRAKNSSMLLRLPLLWLIEVVTSRVVWGNYGPWKLKIILTVVRIDREAVS